MKVAIIVIFAMLTFSCTSVPVAKSYGFECEKSKFAEKKDYYSVCKFNIELKNMGKVKEFNCYGEVSAKNNFGDGTITEMNYGFVERFSIQERAESEVLYVPVLVAFPEGSRVISVKSGWQKCEYIK